MLSCMNGVIWGCTVAQSSIKGCKIWKHNKIQNQSVISAASLTQIKSQCRAVESASFSVISLSVLSVSTRLVIINEALKQSIRHWSWSELDKDWCLWLVQVLKEDSHQTKEQKAADPAAGKIPDEGPWEVGEISSPETSADLVTDSSLVGVFG